MANLAGLNPEFRIRLDLLMKEAGSRLVISSAVRLRAEQEILWRKYLAGGTLAARPGTSNHERGLAADLNPASGKNYSLLHSLGPKYGFHFPIRGEPWHLELDPARKPLPSTPLAPEKVEAMPQVVSAAWNTHGRGFWVLTDDGGVQTPGFMAPFFGSYPGLKPQFRQGAARKFHTIVSRHDVEGYIIFGDDYSYYSFSAAEWANNSLWDGR